MSRRAELADAAIRTIARDGLRGLTHRAVDREAGLPEGSTSYYFRSREALLKATVERLVDLDFDEAPAEVPQGIDGFTDAATATLVRWMTKERHRQLARYELSLEATRRPELRTVLVESGRRVRAMMAGYFAAAGIPEPERCADEFAACMDGLLFDRIAGAGPESVEAEELRGTVKRLLTAILGG